jgi:hypothetical protein
MARDRSNPDTAGKDMSMDTVRGECQKDGCDDRAARGERYCRAHTR